LSGVSATRPSRAGGSTGGPAGEEVRGAPGSGLDFASPASSSLDELVRLRAVAGALRRRRLSSRAPAAGAAVSRRLGRGLDFAETRSYQPGDDVRLIDWRVTARSGQAHTKLFVEERERPVLLVVDARASMRFATRGMYKSVMAARLAAVLGWSAVAARDRVGGFVIGDDWHAEVRPRSGRRGLMALFRAIVAGQRRVPLDAAGQLGDSLARLRHVAQPGSTVVVLSDFGGFDDSARRALGAQLHRLDLLAVQVSDPLERALPDAGRYELVAADGSADGRLTLDIDGRGDQRARHAARFVARRQAVVDLFARGGHRHVDVSTTDPLTDAAARVLARASAPFVVQTGAR